MKFPRTISLVLALACPSPFIGLLAEEQRSKAPGADATAKLDLNHASQAALEAVPEIGAEAARAIVAARPFKSVDELDRVKGIPAETLEQIRAKVGVSPAADSGGLGASTKKKNRLGEPAATTATAGTRTVNINTASRETLAAIPVIGPELAQTIVAARPFKNLDELSQLKGLSAERLEQVRAVLSVTPTSTRATAP